MTILMRQKKRSGPAGVLLRHFDEFFALESASGILLLAAATLALVWANTPWGASYFHLWELPFTLGVRPYALTKTLHHWINDGLMAVFFLLVGLELKREVLAGELASAKRAALPVAAALGGMLVPAAFYLVLNGGGPGARGWGIPMATDIAFALGVIALLGRQRVPLPLRVFVTAVAIVDDLGAVLVIALFYTAELSPGALGVAALMVAALAALNLGGARRVRWYLLPGVGLWLALVQSGVHATFAGVLLAAAIPTAPRHQAHRPPPELRSPRLHNPLAALEERLHPWVAFGIVPIFALANAGVALGQAGPVTSAVSGGVLLGLLLGKPIGILAGSWLVVRVRLAVLPHAVGWRHLAGAASLCGIGFTMSLFIAMLAFETAPVLLDQAKVGVLAASLLAGISGALLLARRKE